jgi:alanine dehydrogenase
VHDITVTVTVEIDGKTAVETVHATTNANPHLAANDMVERACAAVNGPLRFAGHNRKPWPVER